MVSSLLHKIALVLILAVGLAACDSVEERADAYYQSGLELYEAGDRNRAIVELRNVFALDENHIQARALIAKIFLERGSLGQAYGQYLRLIEQKPDHLEGRLVLAELAFEDRNWEEFDRHGTAAIEIDGTAQRAAAIALGLQYRQAVLDRDAATRAATATKADVLLADLPENAILLNLLLDRFLSAREFGDALAYIDQLIANRPDIRPYYDQRLRLLAALDDRAGIEAQLLEMRALFPEDEVIPNTLLRFYSDNNEMDKVEALLRDLAAAAPDQSAPLTNLIGFLNQVRGVDAAQAELETRLAANPDNITLKAMQATMDFSAGRQDAAVAALEEVLRDAPASAQTNDIRIGLARMLIAMDNSVGAQRLVEEVLAQDPRQVEALKLQAVWQLQSNDPDAAISNLRQALEWAPEDAQILNLLADAHQLSGNPDLARDTLARAAEVSGYQADISLRYARLLIREDRFLPAEDVLKPALRRSPEDVELMSLLGQLYVRMDDQARLTQVIGALRRMDIEGADQAANTLEVQQVNRQSGADEALAMLERLAAGEGAGLSAKLDLLRARLSTGDAAGALSFAQDLLAENPDDPNLRFALAMTQGASGDLAASAAGLRALLDENPMRARIWVELARNQLRQGDPDAARATILDGLAVLPEATDLLWAQASYLESELDIDGAIAIYERLYEQNPGSILAINNLASLLSAYREDEDSLQRAYEVARRLAGTNNPALADTYGWILSRRGAPDEALPYLELAAAALSEDPLVLIHLGQTYAALGRVPEAISALQQAIDLAGPGDTRPQIDQAAAALAGLRAGQNE